MPNSKKRKISKTKKVCDCEVCVLRRENELISKIIKRSNFTGGSIRNDGKVAYLEMEYKSNSVMFTMVFDSDDSESFTATSVLYRGGKAPVEREITIPKLKFALLDILKDCIRQAAERGEL